MNLLMLICSRPYCASHWSWLFAEDRLNDLFGISINEVDSSGWTALHHACNARPASRKVVQRLLDLGADTSLKTNDHEFDATKVASANSTGRHLLSIFTHL
jgi:ankyrin repeat protein